MNGRGYLLVFTGCCEWPVNGGPYPLVWSELTMKSPGRTGHMGQESQVWSGFPRYTGTWGMRLSEELPGTVAPDSGPWKLVRHTLPMHLPCALVVVSAIGNGQQRTDYLCSQVADIY